MTCLHEDRQKFAEAVSLAMRRVHLSASYIEKDYFISLLLKDISERIPEIGFKGGTALSKVYNVLDRFSEDIDISYTVPAGHALRTNLKYKGIIPACADYNLDIANLKETRSRNNVTQYRVQYPSIVPIQGVPAPRGQIILETSHIQPILKYHAQYVHSYIGDSLQEIHSQWVSDYNLSPFPMRVQDIDVTFIDKVFALCDYYLKGKPIRNSRHIYDLYKLLPRVQVIPDMQGLVTQIRAERQKVSSCISAQKSVNIPALLIEIYNTKFFKHDYERTIRLFRTNMLVSYEEASSVLLIIAHSRWFGDLPSVLLASRI